MRIARPSASRERIVIVVPRPSPRERPRSSAAQLDDPPSWRDLQSVCVPLIERHVIECTASGRTAVCVLSGLGNADLKDCWTEGGPMMTKRQYAAAVLAPLLFVVGHVNAHHSGWVFDHSTTIAVQKPARLTGWPAARGADHRTRRTKRRLDLRPVRAIRASATHAGRQHYGPDLDAGRSGSHVRIQAGWHLGDFLPACRWQHDRRATADGRGKHVLSPGVVVAPMAGRSPWPRKAASVRLVDSQPTRRAACGCFHATRMSSTSFMISQRQATSGQPSPRKGSGSRTTRSAPAAGGGERRCSRSRPRALSTS